MRGRLWGGRCRRSHGRRRGLGSPWSRSRPLIQTPYRTRKFLWQNPHQRTALTRSTFLSCPRVASNEELRKSGMIPDVGKRPMVQRSKTLHRSRERSGTPASLIGPSVDACRQSRRRASRHDRWRWRSPARTPPLVTVLSRGEGTEAFPCTRETRAVEVISDAGGTP